MKPSLARVVIRERHKVDEMKIMELITIGRSFGLSLCDVYRLINWDVLAEIAKRTDTKIDDTVISVLRTAGGALCKKK